MKDKPIDVLEIKVCRNSYWKTNLLVSESKSEDWSFDVLQILESRSEHWQTGESESEQ